MKKKLCFIGLLIVMAFIVHDVVAVQLDLNAMREKVTPVDVQTRSGGSCKWKKDSCPGWFNGTREVCLVDGDGRSCSCGEVTRLCPGSGGQPGGDDRDDAG